jgi:hypothetical protein
MQKNAAGNLATQSKLINNYTDCHSSIHFFCLYFRQKFQSGVALREIPQRSHLLSLIVAGGMVLAIPLTQAAVGPFRSVLTSASGR